MQQALARAYQLREDGQFEESARIYARLAGEAYKRGRLRPGIKMDLDAARVYLDGALYESAQSHLLHALQTSLEHTMPLRGIRPLGERICSAMEASGDAAGAQAFRDKIAALLQEHGKSLDSIPSSASEPAAKAQRGRLPAQCPACYAPLRSDEVEWVESDRAQCSYCGRVILTE